MECNAILQFGPRLCLMLVTLSGCLPTPGRERDFPETTGVLALNGTPLANVPVAAVILPPATSDTALAHVCHAASSSVRLASRTDAQGRFRFPEHWHSVSQTPLIGDRWEFGWALCVLAPVTASVPERHASPGARLDGTAAAGAWRLVYAAANSGALGAQLRQYTCDLGTAVTDEWRTRLGRIGHCRLVLPPEPHPFTHPLPPVTTIGSS